MQGRSALACVVLSTACLWAAGCNDHYSIETTVHEDGSVDRWFQQREDTVPEKARATERWSEVQRDGRGGLEAKGRFRSVEDIPDHYVRQAPEGSGLADGKLAREYRKTDYVLVVEHRWRETLTDSWSLDGMRKARDELAGEAIAACREVFDDALGKDYDGADLFEWARKEGKDWLVEATDDLLLLVRLAVHQRADTSSVDAAATAIKEDLAAICARHGLVLKADGKLLDDEGCNRAGKEFFLGLVERHVRDRRTGRPVDRATVSAWLEELEKKPDADPPGLFRAASERVIARRYGGQEAMEKRARALLARIGGLYAGDFMPPDFIFRLTVPGAIVETDGSLLSDGSVRWMFPSAEAFPYGRDMTCRSLAPDRETQKALLGAAPLESREDMLRYVELVAGNEPLLAALRECRERKSLEPLREYRKASDPMSVDPLLSLLKVPVSSR